MRPIGALIAFMCAGCYAALRDDVKAPVGAVQRSNASTLLVTYYGEPDLPPKTIEVPSSAGNYDAYLDMVGGEVRMGEKREIPCSIGRVSMLANGDLLYNIAPAADRPDAVEHVTRGTARYDELLNAYPGLTAGHFRLIRC
jgi:hypothetical protein